MSKFKNYVETKNRYKDLGEKLKRAQKEFEKTLPFKGFDKYYFVDSEERILESEWHFTDKDISRYNVGNVFDSVKQAEKELLKRKLVSNIAQFRRECYGDWKPDWGNNDEEKYSIESNGLCLFPKKTSRDTFNIFGYFKYENECKKALELFNDDLYKWLNS